MTTVSQARRHDTGFPNLARFGQIEESTRADPTADRIGRMAEQERLVRHGIDSLAAHRHWGPLRAAGCNARWEAGSGVVVWLGGVAVHS